MRVSIVVPTWKHGQHVYECLGSLLFGQTYRDFEMVMVMDGRECQDPQTLRWLEQFGKHPQLRVLWHETNRGQAAAINTGMDAAVGTDYRTWVHNDNRFDTHWLEKLVGYLDEHRDVDFVYSWCVKERGDHHGNMWQVKHKEMMRECSQSFLFRTAHERKVGPQRGGYAHDYDWMMRSQEAGKWGELPEFLMQRRIHPGGVSQTQRHLDDGAHWKEETRKRRSK